jgi:iduronate 2-sulfatase
MRSIIFLAFLVYCGSHGACAQTIAGAYFAFQDAADAYSETVTASTFPGTPVFSKTGTALGTYSNAGPTFTAFDGLVRPTGLCATWRGEVAGGSDNNSWQVSLNTTGVTQLSARFKYRLNNVASGGVPVGGLSAFEYQVGSGDFQPVPGAALGLSNNTSYDNTWTVNLTGLTAIENQSALTLRWKLPDLDQVAGTQVRMDDLQITGTVEGPPRAGKYNVLFVFVDDLKANFGPFAAGAMGPRMPLPVTPNFDALAASGMSFTRAHCQQAVCSPSRTSVLTGLRPDTTKVWDLQTSFRNTIPNVITLPQHFSSKGYRTSAFGKIFHGGAPPTQDVPISFESENNGRAPHKYYEDGHWQVESASPSTSGSLYATDAGVTNSWVNPPRPVANDDYVDGLIASRSIAQLQTYAANYLANGERFFLAVGFHNPHLPFVCPKAFWDLYDPAQIPLDGYTGTRNLPLGTLPFTAPYGNEPTSFDDINGTVDTGNVTDIGEARRLIHGYLACVSHADAQFGRVMAALEASGVADNTVIVLLGDHGWHLGDHNGFWTKHSNYEQSTRTPVIVSVPGMLDTLGTAGATCHAPVELVDLYPTLVDLAELPAPAQPAGLEAQGTSLRPLLEDPAQPWKRGVFSQFTRFIAGPGLTHQGNGMGYTIRTGRYRYTEWWRTSTSATNAQGNIIDRDVKLYTAPEHVELYDMITDPGETVNLSEEAAYASLVAELSTALAGGNGWSAAAVAKPAVFPTTFPAWQSALVQPGYPLANFADALDPDGDGVLNLMEYALGTDPLSSDESVIGSGLLTLSGSRYLALEYPLIGARTDVSATAVTATDLTSWSETGVITEDLGTRSNHTLWRSRVPMDGTVPPARFLRLKVER